MIVKSITYRDNNKELRCDFKAENPFKVNIDYSACELSKIAFSLRIEFHLEIEQIRNHDYKWISNNETFISNWFSPKIIRLKDGSLIQANITTGIWEIEPKEKRILYWHFNRENSKPFTEYTGSKNAKEIKQATFFDTKEPLVLLISKEHAIEFSRSEIPFSSIACFTDHCDFDTQENLILQRAFFKRHNIKITKGFFINDFSNRPNASYKVNSKELEKWREDGHELAYHSLSQSIKNDEDSFEDFESFRPPFKEVNTWIDHGYQPYNFSLFINNNKKEKWFEKILSDKSIKTLWNYIDSGSATRGVINQINPKHFTLKEYSKGIRNYGLKDRVAAIIKSILFHYYNNETYALAYKDIARYYKLTFINKEIKYVFKLIVSVIRVKFILLKVLLFWRTKSKKTFPLAKYTPLVFKYKLSKNIFNIFQTIEMVDFKNALCKENVELLIDEKGLFVAHTYFSVPLSYHKGKLFKTETEIDKQVDEIFEYLSNKIKSKEVWNPTLNQLISYFNKIETIVFDIDSSNQIYLKSPSNIHTRIIN